MVKDISIKYQHKENSGLILVTEKTGLEGEDLNKGQIAMINATLTFVK